MYIEQVRTSSNTFISYLLGSLVLVLFTLIGQIPLTQAIFQYAQGPVDPSNASELMNAIPSQPRLLLQMLPFAVLFLGMWFVNRFLHQLNFHQLITSRRDVDWNRILFSFWLWGGATIILLLFGCLMAPEEYVLNFKWRTFLPLLFLGTLLIPIQTSAEELLFRGYLLQGFGVLFKNRWLPLILTSVLFGGLHYANPEVDQFGLGIMFYYIGTGFFLGIITLVDEGLELALGFHAANNLFGALLMSSEWSAFQTDAILIFTGQPVLWGEIIISLGLCYPIVFYLFYRKYHWKKISNKLL